MRFLKAAVWGFLRRLDAALERLRSMEKGKRLDRQMRLDSSSSLGPRAVVENNRGDREAINIGPHCIIQGELLTYRHGGQITLGSYVYVGPQTKIWSSASVTIGNYVLISYNVTIHDNDSHSTDVQIRRNHLQYIIDNGMLPLSAYGAGEAEIIIEDDAWICANATILKGVRIGRGAIVGACSVVTKDVAPFTVVAGNPAVIVRNLETK